VDERVRRLLAAALPARELDVRLVHRQAGAGSLGRLPRRGPRELAWRMNRAAKPRRAREPAARQNESRLLWMMGWETANMHLGSLQQLTTAAEHMGEAVTRDWRQWRK